MARRSDEIVRLDDADLASRFSNVCEICPIELWSDDATLERADPGRNRFELWVPYRGDDELWHLYPSKVLVGVLGEVFRGHLVLIDFGESEAAARNHFAQRLAEIDIVITQQVERIQLFEEALPSFIQAEALKLRAQILSKFTGLRH